MIAGKKISIGYDKALIQNFDFEFESGDLVALWGANGSGKTTFFKSLMGWVSVLEGQVELDGALVNGLSSQQIESAMMYLPASFIADEELKAFEYLLFSLGHDILQSFLDPFNCSEFLEKSVSELSDGQKRMLQLTVVANTKAKVLLLDEPSVFLDFENQNKLIALLKQLSDNQKTVVFSSHNKYLIDQLNLKRIEFIEGQGIPSVISR